MVVAIRGAITVAANTREEILNGTTELILHILNVNNLSEENLISMFFTVTPDLDSAFPAEAVRLCGIEQTALMCATEIPVQNSLPLCIRVMIHCNTELNKNEIKHVYLREAASLRTDLTKDDD